MDKQYHKVSDIQFGHKTMRILIDGHAWEFEYKKISKKLSVATKEQRANCEVSPSGYGIRWPELDEDISVDGLIGIKHQRAKRKTA